MIDHPNKIHNRKSAKAYKSQRFDNRCLVISYICDCQFFRYSFRPSNQTRAVYWDESWFIKRKKKYWYENIKLERIPKMFLQTFFNETFFYRFFPVKISWRKGETFSSGIIEEPVKFDKLLRLNVSRRKNTSGVPSLDRKFLPKFLLSVSRNFRQY